MQPVKVLGPYNTAGLGETLHFSSVTAAPRQHMSEPAVEETQNYVSLIIHTGVHLAKKNELKK